MYKSEELLLNVVSALTNLSYYDVKESIICQNRSTIAQGKNIRVYIYTYAGMYTYIQKIRMSKKALYICQNRSTIAQGKNIRVYIYTYAGMYTYIQKIRMSKKALYIYMPKSLKIAQPFVLYMYVCMYVCIFSPVPNLISVCNYVV
jgi:hypothetical protein